MMLKNLAKLNINKLLLIYILILAVSLRLYGLNWDQGSHLHPDERAIVMAVEGIHWPVTTEEKSNLFTPLSSLNPRFFAYGSFPFYLLKGLGQLAGKYDIRYSQYDQLNILGRFVSSIFELGTIFVIYLIGKKLASEKMGLWGAFIYTLGVLPVQLAHFFAVDTLLTFFITATLYAAISFAKENKTRWVVGMGVWYGLAMATKISALTLVIPIIFVIVGKLWRSPLALLKHTLIAVLFAASVFAIFEPFAIIDYAMFKRQLMEQQAMTRSAYTFPYTLQYVGKVPYLHEFKNIFMWGLGPLSATICIAGVLWLTFFAIRRRKLPELILVSFLWIYFAVVGKFAIGFIRYLLPIYPVLALGGAFLLAKIDTNRKQNLVLITVVTVLYLVWPLSFVSIYSQPNARTTASEWIYSNIPAGTKIAREHWDDGMPVGGPNHFEYLEMPMYEPDTPEKWEKVNKVLAESDYIIIASHRLYVPLMKMTDCAKLIPGRCYPQTAEYYQKLFKDELEFKKVAEFWVKPTVPFTNIQINDFSSDETFTVYDHPKIMIFKKT
jgi:hypothetical protein